MTTDQQTSLLSDSDLQAVEQSRYHNLHSGSSIGIAELNTWKTRVIRFQKAIKIAPVVAQGNLFVSTALSADMEAPDIEVPDTETPDPDTIDPFQLPQKNTEFWRWTVSDVGVAALYFVIDYEAGILLYIGETIKSNQRWKGLHDCKRYLMNYRQVHYQLELDSQLGIAFWPHAPEARRPRQQLESTLIYKWRAPFNKENWQFWGTPFIGEKAE